MGGGDLSLGQTATTSLLFPYSIYYLLKFSCCCCNVGKKSLRRKRPCLTFAAGMRLESVSVLCRPGFLVPINEDMSTRCLPPKCCLSQKLAEESNFLGRHVHYCIVVNLVARQQDKKCIFCCPNENAYLAHQLTCCFAATQFLDCQRSFSIISSQQKSFSTF